MTVPAPAAAVPYARFAMLSRWAADSASWVVAVSDSRGAVLAAALSGVAATVDAHQPGPTGACRICINDPEAPNWPGPWPCSVVRLLARDLIGPLERLAASAQRVRAAQGSSPDPKARAGGP